MSSGFSAGFFVRLWQEGYKKGNRLQKMAYRASSMEPIGTMDATIVNPASTPTTPIVPPQPLKMMNTSDPYAPIRAQVMKPMKLLENVFGRDIRADQSCRNPRAAEWLKPAMTARTQMHGGTLPYATSPRLKRAPLQRLTPEDTRVPRGEWNEALARAGPFYDRWWQIWDYAPFKPSNGDIALDPRYNSNQMRCFTSGYKTRGL